MGSFGRLVLAACFASNALLTQHAGAAAVTNDSPSAGKNPLADDGFVEVVRKTMDLFHAPGLAIAVVDGSEEFSKGYGLEHFDDPDRKCTDETLFYAGSTTKAQTAACLSMLINDKTYPELSDGWSTSLASILDGDFQYQDEWATAHLTLNDLVSHRHGLPRHDRALMQEKDGQALSLQELVRNTRNLADPNEARVQAIYGNHAYMTLSLVIERLTKKPLKEVMRELLWDPLGMTSTYFGLQDARDGAGDRLAAGHVWLPESEKLRNVTYMPLTDVSGAAAVVSNVKDYARWIKALLNQTELFSPEVYADIKQPRMVYEPYSNKITDVSLYGLGWFRTTYKGHVVYMHDGSMIGFKSWVWWFPDDEYGLVMFTNSDESGTLLKILAWQHLIADRFAVPEQDRFNLTQEYLDDVQTTPAQRYDNAVKQLYPEHAKPAGNEAQTSSSFSPEDLAGTYADEGYGRMALRVADNGTLTVERPEMTWRYGLTFRHVYADHWIASEAWLEDMANPGLHHPVEFLKEGGKDGRPGAMRIAWQAGGKTEANVTFSREASL
ncbi:hypothetical protein CDD83_8264 [Cordyceps sp. RAO-2017]|nr:hypothetical protein CDD83_8264 [Cordyceps sp. RAO-2017]